MLKLTAYSISALTAVVALYSGISGKGIWFITSTRAAVITLFAAGFLMCSLGNLVVFVGKGPAHPLSIMGYLLGTAALVISLAQIFKWKLPYFSEPGSALSAIAVIILIKFVIARFGFVLIK